jgi:hypothetical protein
MAPFVMEPINSRIVQRSNFLAPKPYGSDFKYREAMGVSSIFIATAVSALTVAIGAMFSIPFLRNFAKK